MWQDTTPVGPFSQQIQIYNTSSMTHAQLFLTEFSVWLTALLWEKNLDRIRCITELPVIINSNLTLNTIQKTDYRIHVYSSFGSVSSR